MCGFKDYTYPGLTQGGTMENLRRGGENGNFLKKPLQYWELSVLIHYTDIYLFSYYCYWINGLITNCYYGKPISTDSHLLIYIQ